MLTEQMKENRASKRLLTKGRIPLEDGRAKYTDTV